MSDLNPQEGIKGEATTVADPLFEPIPRIVASAGGVSDSDGCVSVVLQINQEGSSKAFESCGTD